MLKRLRFIAILFLLFTMLACHGNENNNHTNDPLTELQFIEDPTLNKYLNNSEILDNIRNNPFGSIGPNLAYANNNYLVIHHFDAIIIYNTVDKHMSGIIDLVGLDMNLMQGNDATEICGNEDYIYIYKISNNTSGYIYSLKSDKLSRVDEFTKRDLFENKTIVSEDIFNKIKSDILPINDSDFFDIYKTDDKLYVFRYDPNSVDSWKIITLDDEFNVLSEFYLFIQR